MEKKLFNKRLSDENISYDGSILITKNEFRKLIVFYLSFDYNNEQKIENV